MIKTITKHMSSTDVIAEIYDTIRVGDYGAYVLNLVLDDLESISGDVRLRFERSDGQIILTAPVTVSGNTIIHELTASEIAVVSPLNMWVQFSESNLYTPIQIVFDQVLAVPSGTPIPDTDEYPEYLAAIEAAEAATAEVEAIIGMGIVVEDQTTPQTFINGVPKLAADRVIDQDNELSDKKYVDDKVATVTADDFDHNDLDGLQGGGANERYHMTAAENAALHAHSNKTALDAVSGVNTGDQSASSFNHDDLSNKNGGADYQHMTAAQMEALHSHSNKTALDAVSGTNTGDQDVSGAISAHNSDASAHADKESKSNKVTSMTGTSTDTQYPSAKSVYNSTMRLLISRTIGAGENVSAITWTQDDAGNALHLIDAELRIRTGSNGLANGSDAFINLRINSLTSNVYYSTFIGSVATFVNACRVRNSFGYSTLSLKLAGGKCTLDCVGAAGDAANAIGSINTTQGLKTQISNISTIYLFMESLTYFPIGTVIEIYGRTA